MGLWTTTACALLGLACLPARCSVAALQIFSHQCLATLLGKEGSSTAVLLVEVRRRLPARAALWAAVSWLVRAGAAARHRSFLQPWRLRARRRPPQRTRCQRRAMAHQLPDGGACCPQCQLCFWQRERTYFVVHLSYKEAIGMSGGWQTAKSRDEVHIQAGNASANLVDEVKAAVERVRAELGE